MTSLVPSDFKSSGGVESFLSRVLLRHSSDYVLTISPYKNFLILIFEVLVSTKCLRQGLYAEISVASPYFYRGTFTPEKIYYPNSTREEIIESLKREVDRITEIPWRYLQPSTQIY